MDIQREIIEAFQAEHKEQVESIRNVLASLKQHAAAPSDPRWEEAFRMAHSLKGGARVCDLQGVEAIGHRMESLFAGVREGSLRFDEKVADTIYHALDAIEDWMATFTAGRSPASPAETLEAIEHVLQNSKIGQQSPTATPTPAKPVTPAAAPEPIVASSTESATPAETPAEVVAPSKAVHEIESLRVQTQHLDTVLRSTDALFAVNVEQERVGSEFARLFAQIQELQRECDTIRTSAAAALRRMESMPELNDVARHVDAVGQHVRRIARQRRIARSAQQKSARVLRVVSEDLRRAVQHTRMVAAENVLQGLRTTVRNLARDEGKEVEFRAVGLGIQADRMVLQAIKDPLLHALRNAVVHGLEPPDERVAKGKERVGQILLTLRTTGNRLQVLVEDDGRGVDLDLAAREAVDRGFLPEANLQSEAGRERVRRVLFRPGFSTSSTVTELAGRGMGLSVVHETMNRLRGGVRITARAGGGTVLEMSAPLLVTAERLLLVSSAEHTFALPVHAIDRLLRLPPADIRTVEGRNIALAEGVPLPLTTLAQAVGAADAPAHFRGELVSVVVLRTGIQRVGLVVDAFVAEREALIKPLDGPAAEAPHFSGAILLDDSQVVLVVDPVGLTAGGAAPAPLTRAPAMEVAKTPAILIVDDSFTTRTLEKSILEASGYNVRVAVDGVEALSVLRSETVALVITDVQMPRMDGLALVKEIRATPRLESLPVILVTSLDRDEDRQRGLDLGADAYIVKRKFDHHELLSTIQRFLKPRAEVTA